MAPRTLGGDMSGNTPNSRLRVVQTETFCLYWIFEKFFADYRAAGKQQSLQRILKILKISKQHLWCQSKGLEMKKPGSAVNSSENALDKAAIRAKSLPHSNPINRTTCCNH